MWHNLPECAVIWDAKEMEGRRVAGKSREVNTYNTNVKLCQRHFLRLILPYFVNVFFFSHRDSDALPVPVLLLDLVLLLLRAQRAWLPVRLAPVQRQLGGGVHHPGAVGAAVRGAERVDGGLGKKGKYDTFGFDIDL